MTKSPELVEFEPAAERVCKPRPNDVRKDPTRCVIHNHIKEELPWARHVSVGVRTIRLYDYRCEHNPDGLVGKCKECPGVRLVWATPLSAAKAIKEFDAGGDPEFPRIVLRLADAVIETTNANGGSRKSGLEANRRYYAKKRPTRTARERARIKRTRRAS